MKKIIFIAIAIIVLNNANAQSTEKWSLRKCVDYAMKNNISVKQADVQARIAVLQLKQAKLYQLPNASFSTNVGPSFGRSLDLSTNGYNNLVGGK
jgi:outer membrane protein